MGLWHIQLFVLIAALAAAHAEGMSSAQATPAAGATQPRLREGGSLQTASVSTSSASKQGGPLPTGTLERRKTRDEPLKTLPPRPVWIPEIYGVKSPGEKDDTSVYYYGIGNQPLTSVFALVTGKPGEGDGPQTTFLYEGKSEAYIADVLRTANLGNENGTVTGHFNIKCMYEHGMSRGGYCKVGMRTSDDTTMLSTYNSTGTPQTTMTPTQGLLERMRQKTASGIRDIPFPKTHVDAQNTAARVSPYSPSTYTTVLFMWTTLVALVAALIVL